MAQSPSHPIWGLALSGGGIRSATFCFGLMHALAKRQLLTQFDLMSTVSGGGYVGALWGKLCVDLGAHGAQHELSQANGEVCRWLRANGHYLIPSGFRDLLMAQAILLRNFLAMQLALGVLVMALGLVLLGFDLGVWWLDEQLGRSQATFMGEASGTWLAQPRSAWMPTQWLLLGPCLAVAALCMVAYWGWRDDAESRFTWSRRLSTTLTVAVVITGLGVIDRLAWEMAHTTTPIAIWGAGLALLSALMHAKVPNSVALAPRLGPWLSRAAPQLLNALGLCLLVAVACFWVALLHLDIGAYLYRSGPSQLPTLNLAMMHWFWCVVSLGLAIMALMLMPDFIARSSLQPFYQARLTRGYLGAANAARHGHQGTAKDFHPQDDVALCGYRPQQAGGPVHIINACLNHTEAQHRVFNRDRKGHALMVNSVGTSRVRGDLKPNRLGQELTLGAWIAISGAAVAPGLGSSTRPGIAALLTLSGMRLGRWLAQPGVRSWYRLPALLFRELIGLFEISDSAPMYVSDGGHFDNTGVYALLNEQCPFILMADCGADPRYRFDDISTLVRLAQVDLGCHISFMRPTDFGLQYWPQLGSLGDLAAPEGKACLAMAHVDYSDGSEGWILVVKPCLSADLSPELLHYREQHPNFPQESTTDQFFGEAQWEAYFRLGMRSGGFIRDDLCADEPFLKLALQPDDGALRASTVEGQMKLIYPTLRVPNAAMLGGAAATGIGLSALAPLGLPWIVDHLSAWSESREDSSLEALVKLPIPALVASAEWTVKDDRELLRMSTQMMQLSNLACAGERSYRDRRDSYVNTAADLLRTQLKTACDANMCSRPTGCEVLFPSVVEPTYRTFLYCLSGTYGHCNAPRYWPRHAKRSLCLQQDAAPPPPAPPPCTPATAEPPSPVASAASEPADYSKPPPPASGSATATLCSLKTIYIQIYGPGLRDAARLLREDRMGGSMPPIEDIWDSDRRQGRPLRAPVRKPTLIYHNPNDQACADALASKIKSLTKPGGEAPSVQKLPSPLKPQAATIEVWLPNSWEPTQDRGSP